MEFALHPGHKISYLHIENSDPELSNQSPLNPFKSFVIKLLLVFIWFAGQPIAASAQIKTHTIKSGETLSSIAKKYKTTVAELERLNPETKSGIRAGNTIKVEGSPESEAKEEPGGKATAALSTSGKTHLVKPGESLYKIAKKYKVSAADLEKWNGIDNKGLKSGQEIYVSDPGNLAKEEEQVKEVKVESAETASATHEVSKGQTLSSIAKQHNTTVADLKKLNGLKTNSVSIGQLLKVPGSNPKEEVVEEPRPVAKAEVPVVVKEQKQEPKAKQVPPVTQPFESPKQAPAPVEKEIPAQDERANSGSITEVSNTLGYTRVLETGFAEAIEGDGNSKKHLCLHKTAPVGSILQVKNEANGQSVYVKVIGKLPETGSNEKLIIRISRQAYDKLLAVGKRFPVEVSYPLAQ